MDRFISCQKDPRLPEVSEPDIARSSTGWAFHNDTGRNLRPMPQWVEQIGCLEGSDAPERGGVDKIGERSVEWS